MSPIMLMWLFPYHKYNIESHLKPEVLIERLKGNITFGVNRYYLRPGFYDAKPEKYFKGKYYGNTFKIHRSITGRNSLLPMIRCEITKNEARTRISVRMRLHPIVLIFCFFITIVGNSRGSGINHIKFVYDPVPFIIALGFYFFSLLMFKYEAKADEMVLIKTLNAENEK